MKTTDSTRRLARVAVTGVMAFGLCGLLAPAWAQERASLPAAQVDRNDLPDARQILRKYVEATGGEEAYRNLRTQRATGTFNLAMAGMQGRFEMFQKTPDKFLVMVDLPGMGQLQNGVNGDIAWSVDPMSGPRLLEGEELRAAKREADMNIYLEPEKHYEKMEVKGTEEVRGSKAYHVVMTPREGRNPVEAYFDAESGLLVKQVVTQHGPMGEIKAENYLEDYRETADGKFKQPHKITTRAAGQEFVITLERIEVNAEIEDNRFEPPAEVKRLAERARERGNGDQNGGGM
jgi:hypothetical protein